MAPSSSFFPHLIFSNILLTILFADPHPRPPLVDSKVTYLRIFNALSEEEKSYKTLVTTNKLHKLGFYPSGATSRT